MHPIRAAHDAVDEVTDVLAQVLDDDRLAVVVLQLRALSDVPFDAHASRVATALDVALAAVVDVRLAPSQRRIVQSARAVHRVVIAHAHRNERKEKTAC